MLRWLVLPTVLLGSIPTTASGAAGRDTDRDGLRDAAEIRRHHTNPRTKDTDRDGLRDAAEVRRYHTNPRRKDTDRDGLRDAAEVRRYHTNPRRKDTDRDGLRDAAEVRRYHTNPRKRDTDRDGFGDGVEVRARTNPRDPRSHPRRGASDSPQGAAPTGPGGAPGPGSPAGFPNPSSTGVPAGTALTPYTGPDTVSTPNTVIAGKTIGCIGVTAPGVVIRNSKISCADAAPDAVSSADRDYSGTPLLIEDSEIDCKNTGGTAVGDTNITARRLDIHGCENGFDIDANVTVQDSYIHDLYNSAEAHTDGIQLASGHYVGGNLVPGARDVTIRHNTIYGVGADGSLGTSAIISNSGGDTNILIQDNLLAGGAYTLYCEQHTKGTNYRVINNHFSRKFSSEVGAYGPSTDCSDETQSGNVYHETGQPLKLD